MIIYPIKNFNPLSFFKKDKKFTKHISMFLTLAFLHLVIGCSYYNVRHVSTPPSDLAIHIEELVKSHDYIIIHSGEEIWHLGNAFIDSDNNLISGIIHYGDYSHDFRNIRKIGRAYSYNKSKESPLNELHLYLDSIAITKVGHEISIPISKIKTVSVNDKNTERTITDMIVTAGVLGIIVAIIIYTLNNISLSFG